MKYLVFLFFSAVCFSQETFVDSKFNFSILQPKDWIKAEKNESVQNLKEQIKLSEDEINALIEQNKGTVEIATFYKYAINSVNGVIPTIKVNLRKNPTRRISEFKMMIENSVSSIKVTFPEMKITSEPEIRKINDKDCVYFESLNSIPTRKGKQQVRTITYAVPVGEYFFQINFMDTPEDNNEELFRQVVETIKL